MTSSGVLVACATDCFVSKPLNLLVEEANGDQDDQKPQKPNVTWVDGVPRTVAKPKPAGDYVKR